MKSVRRVGLLLALASTLGLVLGCAGEEPGTPVPTSAGVVSGSPVPEVSTPLDASGYLNSPCEIVAQNSLSKLGYTDTGQNRTEDSNGTSAISGPSCGWLHPDSAKTISVLLQTGNRENGLGGLDGNYRAYQQGQYAYWEPARIDGYPAAYSDISDMREQGRCRLIVGIADDLAFDVQASSYFDQPNQACIDAKQVAEQVIATLKGGS